MNVERDSIIIKYKICMLLVVKFLNLSTYLKCVRTALYLFVPHGKEKVQ